MCLVILSSVACLVLWYSERRVMETCISVTLDSVEVMWRELWIGHDLLSSAYLLSVHNPHVPWAPTTPAVETALRNKEIIVLFPYYMQTINITCLIRWMYVHKWILIQLLTSTEILQGQRPFTFNRNLSVRRPDVYSKRNIFNTSVVSDCSRSAGLYSISDIFLFTNPYPPAFPYGNAVG